jgi:hypothetical protein
MPPKKINVRMNQTRSFKKYQIETNFEEELPEEEELPQEEEVPQEEEHGAAGSGRSYITPVLFYGAARGSRFALIAQAIEDDRNHDFEGFGQEPLQLRPEPPLPLPFEDERNHEFEGFGQEPLELQPEPPLPLYTNTALLKRKTLLLNNRRYCDSLETTITSNDQHVGMAFIPNQAILDLANKFRCPELGCMEFDQDNDVSLTHIQLDTKITVTCHSCDQVLYLYDPVKVINNVRVCPGTAGVVDQCMATGSGHIGVQRFAFGAELAGQLNTYQWEKYSRCQGQQSLKMYEEHLPIVNQCVRDSAHERDVFSDDDGIMDVDVSYDGTWLTRGHKSNLGMGFVIEADTGFVIDHNVLSKFCQACDRIKKTHADNADDREAALVLHKDRGNCLSNYNGVSGGMEKENAVRMWDRSIEKNGMRYTKFISDGDSNAYNAVRDRDPYDGKSIEKLECVNHVQKRLGSRLRKLKKETFIEVTNEATGKTTKRCTIGGRGKLTDDTIERLTGYYGAGIKRTVGTTVQEMKKACLSGFKHVTSSDANPDHEYCEEGEGSYCFYNKALAKNQVPPSHSTMKVKCTLDPTERQKVMTIYKDLSSDELLHKCVSGKTQNPNESIHQKVWNKLSKTKHYGLKTAEYSAAQTVVEHNLGYEYAMKHGKMDFGAQMPSSVAEGSERRDKQRIRHSVTPKPKKKRYANAPQQDEDYGPGEH